MANRAYVRVWTREFSPSTLIEQFARYLATAPHCASGQSFTQLIVQPIDPSQTPVEEWVLRGQGFGAAEVAALAAQHLHEDTAYFVSAEWDLWQFDVESLKWQQKPAPLNLICHGPGYDEGVSSTAGNFAADLGFEHLFTGHAGLLSECSGRETAAGDTPEDPVEHTFRRWMAAEANLREYHQKTRENIEQLMNWTAAIERALPVERTEMWSEGEENFEARLDQILVVR